MTDTAQKLWDSSDKGISAIFRLYMSAWNLDKVDYSAMCNEARKTPQGKAMLEKLATLPWFNTMVVEGYDATINPLSKDEQKSVFKAWEAQDVHEAIAETLDAMHEYYLTEGNEIPQ